MKRECCGISVALCGSAIVVFGCNSLLATGLGTEVNRPHGTDVVSTGDVKTVIPQTIDGMVRRAQEYAKIGFLNREDHYVYGDVGKDNFAEARKYFKYAQKAIDKENATLWLKLGWFNYWTPSEIRQKKPAGNMLEKAWQLEPDNPEACYKIGRVRLDAYYAMIEGPIEEQKIEKILPDGSHLLAETDYTYSDKRDLSDLDAAEQLLKKAIQLKPDFADAYWLLGHKIYLHKKDLDRTRDCYAAFLRNTDKIDMELNLYDQERVDSMIKRAKKYLSQ